jgi:tripartite-type tricarboxylate transporter receptor subunit TctC
MTFTRRATLGLLAAPALGRVASAATLQRTGRVIIGFPAGGSSDITARLYAERLRGDYAPQVVVENRVGAAGRIAVEAVKAAAPDGETWLQTPASMLTLQPFVFPRQVRYDALTDFAAVSTVVNFPFALAVPAAHPAQDFAQYVTWARAQSEIAYASPAAGSAPHFLGVMLGRAIGARMSHVSYRGAVPALQDLIGGRIQTFVGVLGDIVPYRDQGARILAVSTQRRVARYPQIPTFAELGHPQLTKVEWFGVLLPGATPAPLVTALHAALGRAAQAPELRGPLEQQDYEVVTSPSPSAFADRIRRERAEWEQVVKESGFQPEE